MKQLRRKQKLIAIIGGVFVVCLVALGIMYKTGVFPPQTEGRMELLCNKNCPCHYYGPKGLMCGRCENCQ